MPAPRRILIRGARQLLTLHGPPGPRRGRDLGELGIVQDGAVLIVDGVIQEVGPSRRVEALAAARDAAEINAAGRVVMPAFVDCHTHLIAPTRAAEMAENARSPEGITAATASRALREATAKSIEAMAMSAIEDAVRLGTTTLEAKSGFGVDEAGELKILRVHGVIAERTINLVSTVMGTRWAMPDPDAYIAWMCLEMLPLVRKRRLAEFADIYCEQGVFSIAQARRYLATARQLGLVPKMHAGQYSNIGGAQLAVEVDAASVDHLVYADVNDADVVASSGTMATLLPGPPFYMATSRYPPARMLIDRGAAVALASNYNPQTCPSQNMQMMIALACRKMRMTPAEAVSAATINGAHALRRASRVGSLEAGKDADILVLSVPDYRDVPYHFGVSTVDMTMHRGEIIFQRSSVRWPGL